MGVTDLWRKLGKGLIELVGREVISRFMSGKMSDAQLRALLTAPTALELIKAKQDILAKQKLGPK